MTNISLDSSLKKAQNLEKTNKKHDAAKLYFEIIKKFPNNSKVLYKLVEIHKFLATPHIDNLTRLYNSNHLDEVIIQAHNLISKYSYSLDILNILGITLNAKFKYNDAIKIFNKIISIDPNFYQAHFNLGISYQHLEKKQLAIKCYNIVLKIKPNHYPSLNNIAIAQTKLGDFEAALYSYNQVLKHNPNDPQVYNSIGILYKDSGNVNLAIQNFNKAIEIDENYYKAYYNLGIVYKLIGILESALKYFEKALNINPNYNNALYNAAELLSGYVSNGPNTKILNLIETILKKENIVSPYKVANPAIRLLKHENDFQILFKEYENLNQKNLFEAIQSISKKSILLILMKSCPLGDLKLEKLITKIRTSLLNYIYDINYSEDILNLQSAISQQCFINEYIYETENFEIPKINKLEKLIEKNLLDGIQPKPQFIFCLSSYKPLNKYKWINLLKNNSVITEVYTQQFLQFKEENTIKSNIENLHNITDKISSKVQEQYESNPYPKWIDLSLQKEPISISQLTKNLNIIDKNINEVTSPSILIAGCGTGQHSIFEAKRFRNSNVTAIDLSLSSLAYAIRKTKELQIDNIQYFQADILNLKNLVCKFDIIESVGVLHHMKNPIDGANILTNCLKKGGLLRLGLYSEIARRHIVNIRNTIKNLNLQSNVSSMKSFRKILIESEDQNYEDIKKSADFYSLSTFRDLLFHVQEHRFSLIEIKEMLFNLGLEFCGFEDQKLILDFQKYFHADDQYDLNKWDIYEKENPNSFMNMYQFWCQKV